VEVAGKLLCAAWTQSMGKQAFALSPTDRRYLEELLRKGQMSARQFKRATGLLELERGKCISAVSQTLDVRWETVSNWAKRYQQEGLQMLHDKARSGRPVEIDGGQRAEITALACSTPPVGHSRWTLRLLADKAVELNCCEHVSHTQVNQILKKTS
jgi:putative transposase